MNQEYTTAEELVEELEEDPSVMRARVVNPNCVTFDVKEKAHMFDFPGHIGWFVDSMTHYNDERIHFRMVLVV